MMVSIGVVCKATDVNINRILGLDANTFGFSHNGDFYSAARKQKIGYKFSEGDVVEIAVNFKKGYVKMIHNGDKKYSLKLKSS